jgi:hypothetical protein
MTKADEAAVRSRPPSTFRSRGKLGWRGVKQVDVRLLRNSP